MSRTILFASALLLAASAVSASGADAPSQEDMERCERYAAEDEVSPQEWEDYMEECLADLAEDVAPEDVVPDYAADSDAAMSASDADAPSPEGDTERCERYAVEDEVPPHERDEYVEQCLAERNAGMVPAYGPDSDAPALRIDASD